MSSDLVWQLVRNNNVFLVKRNGVCFSRERTNVTNEHKPRFSGLANLKTVGVVSQNNKVKVLVKQTKKCNAQVTVKGAKKHYADSAVALTNLLSTYRPDLTKKAVARHHALVKASTRKTSPVAPKARRTFKKN